MYPKGLYRRSVLTVQSTRVGNVFPSRQARSARDEMQQLLTNMCCNIRAQLGAKSEDAKCLQGRVEEENSGRQRPSSAEVALNKDPSISPPSIFPPFLESLEPSIYPRNILAFVLKHHSCTMKPFCPGTRVYCASSNTTVRNKTRELYIQIFMNFPLSEFGTPRQTCLPIRLCFNT